MKNRECVKVPAWALRNMAKTLEMALSALNGDQMASGIYEKIGVTPEQVIKRQADKLCALSYGLDYIDEEKQ